jgi:hypothetical protein
MRPKVARTAAAHQEVRPGFLKYRCNIPNTRYIGRARLLPSRGGSHYGPGYDSFGHLGVCSGELDRAFSPSTFTRARPGPMAQAGMLPRRWRSCRALCRQVDEALQERVSVGQRQRRLTFGDYGNHSDRRSLVVAVRKAALIDRGLDSGPRGP